MFVQSKAVTDPRHKDGLALQQRRGGRDTLIQWSNGDRHWCLTNDLEYFGETITLVHQDTDGDYSDE